MAQLSYTTTMPRGFAGMKVDTAEDIVDTAHSEEASAEIPFGVFVKKGTADGGVLLMTAANNVIAGITIHSHASQVGTGGGLSSKAAVNLGTRCRVLMTSEQSVVPTDPVFVRYAAGGAASALRGTVRKDADTNGAVRVPGARFMTTAAASALVEVEFNKAAYEAALAAVALSA